MSQHRFVVCVENAEYPASLELRKIYESIPDAEGARLGLIRVIDESGEDYLYPEAHFIPIDLPQKLEEAFLRLT